MNVGATNTLGYVLFQFDFWIGPSRVHRFVDVSVSPDQKRQFLSQLHMRDIRSEILIRDLEEYVVLGLHSLPAIPDES